MCAKAAVPFCFDNVIRSGFRLNRILSRLCYHPVSNSRTYVQRGSKQMHEGTVRYLLSTHSACEENTSNWSIGPTTSSRLAALPSKFCGHHDAFLYHVFGIIPVVVHGKCLWYVGRYWSGSNAVTGISLLRFIWCQYVKISRYWTRMVKICLDDDWSTSSN